ncbi:SHOCT domain-containing protein [Myxococcus sp. NMCA1]|uniref:SHOCT domain-containing protein n=1 Tax=Myxococcus sp. NMCA1 TaxID=2996785 RepID=UPI002285410D|nr:SHOCT domain-containing protein [Myxococcus sp. NMCA1]WAM24114.1 SHOCT domain-containing protein [Myxococcus sp. NMCA1]
MTHLLPATPTEIFVYLLFSGISLYASWTVWGVVRVMMVERHVLKHGEAAEATVRELKDTGWRINKQPLFELLLDVRQSGRAAYQTKVKKKLGRHQSISTMGVGTRLDVKVDRNDPLKVAIVGAAMTAPVGAFMRQGMPSEGDPVKAMQNLQSLMDKGLITPEEFQAKKAQILARI